MTCCCSPLDEQRPLERRHVDLTQIAHDTVQDAHARSPERPIGLSAPAPLTVLGDEQRLRQVAANLVANAQTHTPPGTPVHVSTAAYDGQAIMTVSDEGEGIDPEDEAHVFERFYRGRSSAAHHSPPNAASSGLGLAIVAAIISAHDGSASVRSEPGQGATFEITLALADAQSPRREAWGEPATPRHRETHARDPL